MNATPPSNKWMSNLQIGNSFSDTTDPKTWADFPVDFWVSLPTDEWWQACINTMQLDTTVHDLIGLCRDMTTSVNTQNQDEARPGHQLQTAFGSAASNTEKVKRMTKGHRQSNV